MSNEPNRSEIVKGPADKVRPPREVMEELTVQLRDKQICTKSINRLLTELQASVEQRFQRDAGDNLLQDAIAQAPWLTADAKLLKEKRCQIRSQIGELNHNARNNAISTDQLVAQFQDFVEDFLEYEASEHEFLESAYPSPDWLQ